MEGYGLGLTAIRGQRAPSTEELYKKARTVARPRSRRAIPIWQRDNQ